MTKKVETPFPTVSYFLSPRKFAMVYGVTLTYISHINWLFSGEKIWSLVINIPVDLLNKQMMISDRKPTALETSLSQCHFIHHKFHMD